MSLNLCIDCSCTFDEIVDNPRNCKCGCHKMFKSLLDVHRHATWVDGVGCPTRSEFERLKRLGKTKKVDVKK